MLAQEPLHPQFDKRTLQPEDMESSDVVHVLRPNGSAAPEHDPKLTDEEVLSLYRLMLLNRAIDERMTTLQRQGRIGFYIGSIGEEAAVLGSAYAMRPNDWVLPAYREHGAVLMRGMPLERFLANLFGTADDPVKGRQMPCHESWIDGRVLSISSPLATQLPHAVGLGYAAKLKGKDDVALAYFGEGSTSTNDFHTAMNFAGVFKTPTLFLCRNNQWAISVPLARQTASESIAVKAKAYGMPGVRVDGNDLLAVYAVTKQAHARARAGEGPTLIEAITCRLRGHSTSDDPRAYRREDETAAWAQLDPLVRLKQHLVYKGLWDEARETKARAEVEEQVKRAASAAEKVGAPALETLFQDVYREMPWHLEEQLIQARGRREARASAEQREG